MEFRHSGSGDERFEIVLRERGDGMPALTRFAGWLCERATEKSPAALSINGAEVIFRVSIYEVESVVQPRNEVLSTTFHLATLRARGFCFSAHVIRRAPVRGNILGCLRLYRGTSPPFIVLQLNVHKIYEDKSVCSDARIYSSRFVSSARRGIHTVAISIVITYRLFLS